MIWPALQATEVKADFRNPGGASRWHVSSGVLSNLSQSDGACRQTWFTKDSRQALLTSITILFLRSVATHYGPLVTPLIASSLRSFARSSTADPQSTGQLMCTLTVKIQPQDQDMSSVSTPSLEFTLQPAGKQTKPWRELRDGLTAAQEVVVCQSGLHHTNRRAGQGRKRRDSQLSFRCI